MHKVPPILLPPCSSSLSYRGRLGFELFAQLRVVLGPQVVGVEVLVDVSDGIEGLATMQAHSTENTELATLVCSIQSYHKERTHSQYLDRKGGRCGAASLSHKSEKSVTLLLLTTLMPLSLTRPCPKEEVDVRRLLVIQYRPTEVKKRLPFILLIPQQTKQDFPEAH